jgi:hypothetical protein
MSVVGPDFDTLKQYNIEQLGQAPPVKEKLAE